MKTQAIRVTERQRKARAFFGNFAYGFFVAAACVGTCGFLWVFFTLWLS